MKKEKKLILALAEEFKIEAIEEFLQQYLD